MPSSGAGRCIECLAAIAQLAPIDVDFRHPTTKRGRSCLIPVTGPLEGLCLSNTDWAPIPLQGPLPLRAARRDACHSAAKRKSPAVTRDLLIGQSRRTSAASKPYRTLDVGRVAVAGDIAAGDTALPGTGRTTGADAAGGARWREPASGLPLAAACRFAWCRPGSYRSGPWTASRSNSLVISTRSFFSWMSRTSSSFTSSNAICSGLRPAQARA